MTLPKLDIASLDSALQRFLAAAATVDHAAIAKAKPTAAEWRRLNSLISRAEPELQRAFLRAIALAGNGINAAAVRRAFEAGDIQGAIDAVPWREIGEPELKARLLRGMRDVFDQAGEVSSTLVRNVEPFAFDVLNPRGLQSYAEHGARLIVDITAGVEETIRTAVTMGIGGGVSPVRAAGAIRPLIGLLDASREAKGPYTIQAVQNYRERAMHQGLTGDALEADVARYAQQLTQARALNIARTEATFAAQSGQREAWEQAIEQGLVERGKARREWVAVIDDATDEDCIALDGEIVGFDEPFSSGNMGPPAHPGCRCVLALVVE